MTATADVPDPHAPAKADCLKCQQHGEECSQCYHTGHYHCPVCGTCSTKADRCPVTFCGYNHGLTLGPTHAGEA
jgi:hypothetical protein